jgi:hypothetical protein
VTATLALLPQPSRTDRVGRDRLEILTALISSPFFDPMFRIWICRQLADDLHISGGPGGASVTAVFCLDGHRPDPRAGQPPRSGPPILAGCRVAAIVRNVPCLGTTRGMGIGVGIFLIVVGAILTFAVHASVAGLDLKVVGWILMLAGVAGLILFLYFWHRRRGPRTVVQQPRGYDDTGQPPM